MADALPLESLAIASLRPHARNDGRHPPEELDHLKASITEHGVYRNVVVAQDGTILAGHGVIAAAQALGQTHIPGRRMPYGPDDPRALKLLVGDNHISRLRQQDDAALTALLQDLTRHDPLALLGTGFDEGALEALVQQQGLGGVGGRPEDIQDVEPEIDRADALCEKYQVQEGQIWGCGPHRLCCGDCQDAALVPRFLDGSRPDMVWADPPYGISIVATNVSVGGGEAYNIPFGGVKHPRRRSPVGGGQRTKDLTGHYPIESWGKELRGSVGAAKPFGSKVQQRVRGTDGASHVVAVGKYAPVIGDDSTATAIQMATTFLTIFPDAVHIWWGGNYYADHLPASSCWLVWNKETTGNFADCELAWTNQPKASRLFTHRWNGMLRDSERERRWHPTQKPAALAAWAFAALGEQADVVFDPFLGCGPSLIAAEQLQRTLYGMELSAPYLAVCLERWSVLTGQTPVLLEG